MSLTIYSQGSFDLIHGGHIAFLRRAARLGDLTVSVLTDEAYTAYRGYPPAMPFEHRFAVIAALECVDGVIPGDNRKTAAEPEAVRANIAVIGSDWLSKDIYWQWGVSRDWLDSREITLCYLPYTEGVSSTAIKERIIDDYHVAQNGRRDEVAPAIQAAAVSG